MIRHAVTLSLLVAAVAGDVSRADATPGPVPLPVVPAVSQAGKRPWIDVRVGFEAGGAPLLEPPSGPVAMTTARTSASLFARVSLPVLSSRVVELGWIPHHGVGLMLQSGDLKLGPLQLHVLDLGAFYSSERPVTVSRVARRWDLVVGAGAELALVHGVSLVVDARLFTPVDLWSVVTHYGDTARLIGEEIVHGAQLWAGAAYRW